MSLEFSACELLRIEGRRWILTYPTGLPVYDFAFDRYFACSHPLQPVGASGVIARVGAVSDYGELFAEATSAGVALVHSPEEHQRCSSLEGWYPRVRELTAHTEVFDAFPTADEVEQRLRWPVFVKGARQTARHAKALSVVEGREAWQDLAQRWSAEPILRWQPVAVRAWLPLRPVEPHVHDRLRASFEFRAFVWKGTVVGFGRYWTEAPPYACTEQERADALRLVRQVARRVDVPFLVVDVGQCEDGRWVLIECNDAQESGYAGVSPFALWQELLRAESGDEPIAPDEPRRAGPGGAPRARR